MARVAIVEAYPYAAVWGGDAVYIDRIRQFLLRRGARVESYVTDIVRGRANPLVALPGPAAPEHRWVVRNTVPLGAGRFVAHDPALFAKAALRLLGRRARPDRSIAGCEQAWLVRRLAAAQPDLAILAYGACRFAPDLAECGIPTLALRGWFSERTLRLGEAPVAPRIDPAMLAELRRATRAGFNNRLDLDHYRASSGAGNGVLIGMCFPRRDPAPMSDDPIVLFVGARTPPNVEGLCWFVERCWPAVRAAAPAARLRIVGAVGAAVRSDAAAGIESAGFVADLDREYHRAQVVVAPLRTGTSGAKTKVAEACAYGRPLVTTSIGIDPGAPDLYGEAVDVADDPAAFAGAVVRIVNDTAYRRRRNRLAIEQFDRHFQEQAAYAPLIAMLAALPRPA